jgi:hypothetical protein
MRQPLSYLDDYVNISFRVNSTYYTDQSAVNVMLSPDTDTFASWIPVDRKGFHLEFVNGTDEVGLYKLTNSVGPGALERAWFQPLNTDVCFPGFTKFAFKSNLYRYSSVTGYTKMMGTYFLGQAWPGLAVQNPTEAPLFKEKGPPTSLLGGLNIAPGDQSGDNPIAVTGARVNLQGYFDVEFDSLNLTGCANISVGCIVGNVYAVYFDVIGELTLRPASEAPPEFEGSVRRRLLQVTADPTTDEYVAVLDTTDFADSNVNPNGNPRSASVTVVDNFGGTATGPVVTLPTEPTNDPPIISVNILSLNYVEKELTVGRCKLNPVDPWLESAWFQLLSL